jgi:hypothetical protein
MKKSADITKYDLRWQVLRSSLKGKFNDNLTLKLKKVSDYLNEDKSKDRWERVYNWCEGLLKGIKASASQENLQSLLSYMDFLDNNKHEYKESEKGLSIQESFHLYSQIELVLLLKDLFKTNKGWLEKGYFHKECNCFMDQLYEVVEESLIKDSFSKKSLLLLRAKSLHVTNKHGFFF